MKLGLLAIAAMGVTLSACGVYGPKGNDTGGIIPWSPENDQNAFAIAQSNCGFFNKYAVATSIHRVYGDYIGYRCQWDPPLAAVSRPRRHVNVTIDK
jgi:hypothetical protein